MCFSNDADWYASECVYVRRRSNKHQRCLECGDSIEIGDWFTNVWMREKDYCEICEDQQDDEDLTDEERQHTCDFGEEFECDFCENCRLIRNAIYQVELEEGCPPGKRQPLLCAMADELSQHSQAGVYLQRALEMFPETSSSPLMRYMKTNSGER